MSDFKPTSIDKSKNTHEDNGIKYSSLSLLISFLILSIFGESIPPLLLGLMSLVAFGSLAYLVVAGIRYLINKPKAPSITTTPEIMSNHPKMKKYLWFSLIYIILIVPILLLTLQSLITITYQSASDTPLVFLTVLTIFTTAALPVAIFLFIIFRVANVKRDYFKNSINIFAFLTALIIGSFSFIPCGDGSNAFHFFISLSFTEQSMCGEFSILPIGYAFIMWSCMGYLLIFGFGLVRYLVHKHIDASIISHGDYSLFRNALFWLRALGVIVVIFTSLITISYYSITESGYKFEDNNIWITSGLILK